MPKILVATALAALLVLTACIRAPGARTQAMKQAIRAAKIGGEITASIGVPAGIDPTGVDEPWGGLIVATMCDQLLSIDPETSAIKPAIAESWTVSDQGRKLFVRLRKGVRFQNGREVVADDVAYTMSRLASEQFASGSASLIQDVAGFGFVHGEIKTKDRQLRRRLAGVKIVDEHSVEIDLERPFAEFFKVLTHPALSLIPEESVEKDPEAFSKRPVCVGPYKPDSAFERGKPLALSRVKGEYGKNIAFTRGGAGYLDKITFVSEDFSADVNIVRNVTNPATFPGPGLSGDESSHGHAKHTFGSTGNEKINLQAGYDSQLEMVGFPTSVAPFDDPAVRRALSLAIDRKALASRLGGTLSASDTFLTAGSVPKGVPCKDAQVPNADAARKVLAKAIKPGQELKFYFNNEFDNERIVQTLVQSWASVGVTVTPIAIGWEELTSKATGGQGLDGMFRFGWLPEYPSAERSLVPLFQSNSIGKNDWSRFSSRDFDEAIKQAGKATADQDRDAAYVRAAQVVCDQMPMTPLGFHRRSFVFGDKLGAAANAFIDANDAMPVFRELFVR